MKTFVRRTCGRPLTCRYTSLLAVSGLLLLASAGCGSGGAAPQTTTPAPAPTAQTVPRKYLAPLVGGSSNGGSAIAGPQIYTIDDTADTFSQTTYLLSTQQSGAQIINAGTFATAARGLLSLGVTANYTFDNNLVPPQWVAATPAETVGFALELTGQSGGLIQLPGQPVAPLVPTSVCPTLAKPVTYNFLTIPQSLANSNSAPFGWDPATQTAYGSVQITSSGSTVNFGSIQQSTFPSAGGSTAPAHPSASSVAAVCGPTAFGNTISIPGQVTVKNPGPSYTNPPQAIAGIGPTGLLVEDNGLISSGSTVGEYENALGAGTGTVGLPAPSSALDTASTVAAQYLGFLYGSGIYTDNSPSTGWSSNLVSFGFSSVPANCGSAAASSGTLIYGGDFPNGYSSTSSNGFGNCDLAVDLGPQDSATNGLYPNAVIKLFGTYVGNTTSATYSFPAIAIAGQLQGKNAIFVLGVDPTTSQAWSLFLFQTN